MNVFRRFQPAQSFFPVFSGVVAFAVYTGTLCPTVAFTDTGELATVCTTLGIAHPTGYPLMTFLGRLMVMLMPWREPVVALNLFAAALTAAAVAFMTALLQRNLPRFASIAPGSVITSLISSAASLAVGFGATWWSQSTAFEVYSLHLLFLATILFSFFRSFEESQPDLRWLALTAFLLGLSFGNHMTTILLVPALFQYSFVRMRSFSRLLRLSARMVPFFLLGLSVYLYLPVRASSSPLLDWGHPATLERMFWHVSGKQYRVWMFSGADVMKKQFALYLSGFPGEFHFVLWPLILAGVVEIFSRARSVFWFLVILIATTLLYATNYDIFDIGSYFLLSFVAAGMFLGTGMAVIGKKFAHASRVLRTVGAALLVTVVGIQIAANRSAVDESSMRVAEEYSLDVLNSLPPNAVVLTGQWDYLVSPALYFQHGRNIRPDVVILDKSLLQNRSWYFMQLEQHVPQFAGWAGPEAGRFLGELAKFEREIPFDPAVIAYYWNAFLDSLITRVSIGRPVFADVRVEPELPAHFGRIPSGLLYRLENGKEPAAPVRFPRESGEKIGASGPVATDLRTYEIQVCLSMGRWCAAHGRLSDAARLLSLGEKVRKESAGLRN